MERVSRGQGFEDPYGGSSIQPSSAPSRGRGIYRPGIQSTIPLKYQYDQGNCGTTLEPNDKPILLRTNYVKILPPDTEIEQYTVTFEPNIESTRLRRALVMSSKERFGCAITFDGNQLIRAARPIPYESQTIISHTQRDNQEVTISLQHVGTIAHGSDEMISFYNILMRKCMAVHMDFISYNKDLFQRKEFHSIPKWNTGIHRGYRCAVHPFTGGIMFGIELLTKVIVKNSILSVLLKIKQRAEDEKKNVRNEILRELAGKTCLTEYNNRSYRIEDIEYDIKPNSTFFNSRTGENITYIDYYKKQYNLDITAPGQPMLLVTCKRRGAGSDSEQRIYIVPELSIITGATDEMLADRNFKSNLVEFSNHKPNPRADSEKEFARKLSTDPKCVNEFTEWNMGVKIGFVNVDAKILAPISILGLGNKLITQPVNGVFGEPFDKGMFRFTKMVQLKKVTVIYPRGEGTIAQRLFNQLTLNGNTFGWKYETIERVQLEQPENVNYINGLLANLPETDFIIFILPKSSQTKLKEIYDCVKQHCYVNKGVLCQCVKKYTLLNEKKFNSICINITIQMTAKCGGVPWHVTFPETGPMFIGMDVCHDPKRKFDSMCGFVATLNHQATRFWSRCYKQKDANEMMSTFGQNMVHAYQTFCRINNSNPDTICIFRDGVSEGQIGQIYDHELDYARQILSDSGIDAKIIYIIVTKRISLRLTHKRGNDLFNPPVGACVDQTVTRRYRHEFFLVSQSVTIGTAVPTEYNIIEDESQYSLPQIQSMAYGLCHLYFNDKRSLRIPAPVHYAHKLAKLSADNLGNRPCHNTLEDKLFYL